MKMLLKLLIVLLGAYMAPLHADEYSDATANFRQAPTTQPFFQNAYGYAIFPTVGKGGFVVGGAYGEGRVFRGGAQIGDVSLLQVNIGWQLGGQTYSEIIFFQDKKAFDTFTSGSFSFGAQASAVAIAIGASAQAGSNGSSANAGNQQSESLYTLGMAVFTMTKGGLMYEASIGGQKFSYNARQ
ncbi:MAG TPA: lipid-binding SYLF domain-containing protein [Spongiibacteraceae bacterium]|nr:lipid-binding SYLF domain-containing protein [Spongiibacteraceae bacterium]